MMFSANTRDDNGESFIPASQRPDGSWRKARRVKEGYVPQEEVPLYESKGKQYATRVTKPSEPVSLPSGHVAHQSIPGLFILDDKEKVKSKKKLKNTKIEELSKHLDRTSISEAVKRKPESVKILETSGQSVDPMKRLKNLKKRLREIEVLEEKLKIGEITKPEPEQLNKVHRKPDLLVQIRELELELKV